MMRIVTVALALLWTMLQIAAAESVRVATCEVEGLELPPVDTAPTEDDTPLLRQVAASLRTLEADMVVLHGVPDRQTAKRLVSFLKPPAYHIAFQGVFHKSGGNSPTVGPPVTILTRKEPFTARAMEWRGTGQIDWPGGFAFVGIHSGTNTICLYVAHLPGEPASPEDRENPLMVRRRDLAAHYLAHHANWLATTLSNQLVTALITGDFIADAKGARVESPIRVMHQAGFKMAFPNPSGARSAAGQEDKAPVQPLLTGLLARNAELISTSTRKGNSVRTAAYEVAPVANAPVGGSGLAPSFAGSNSAVPGRVVAVDRGLLWIWGGGIVALSMASLVSVWIIRRTFSAAGMLRRGSASVVLDLSPFSGRGGPYTFPQETGESYSGSTADSSQAAAVWQARAMQAEHRARQAASLLHGRLRPELGRMLRERLIAWLSFQRRALLASTEAGTEQVLELEARLQQIQGQMQEGLRSREERIAELEQEIHAKERIIRDLLRTQVRVASDASPGPHR